MSTKAPRSHSSAEEVYGNLCEHFQPDPESSERRVRGRHPWQVALTIWVLDDPDAEYSARELRVETTDISQTGFGFVFRQFIHPGTTVRTRFDMLKNAPVVDGVVAHCQLQHDGMHRVGVKLMSARS